MSDVTIDQQIDMAVDPAVEDRPPEEQPEDTVADKPMAKLRKRAQAAYAERDVLAGQLASLQRQQVESLIGDVKPEAIWTVTDLPDLLGQDGTVDAEKVLAAVDVARERLGITKPAKGTYVPQIGSQPAVMPNPNGWAQAFAPKRR